MIRYRNPATPRSVAIASTVGAVALATTLFLAAVAVHLVRADVELASLYAEVFGALPQLSDAERFPASGGPLAADAARQLAWWGMAPEDRETINGIFANVGKSIAAFETTLTTGAAPFDRFVADLKAGRQESDAMSQAAQRGLEIFIGRGNCVLCHSGPYLTNKEFHDIRVAPLADEALFDPGRLAGVEQLFADEFVAAGPHSDDRGGVRAQQVLYLDRDVALLGHFKTPSLRNVALTAPYMHQGQLATLRDVVRHYATLEDAVPPADPAHVEVLVRPFELSERDAADLVAFLEALTSPGAVAGR
jgi:cytochrome c peroxidase